MAEVALVVALHAHLYEHVAVADQRKEACGEQIHKCRAASGGSKEQRNNNGAGKTKHGVLAALTNKCLRRKCHGWAMVTGTLWTHQRTGHVAERARLALHARRWGKRTSHTTKLSLWVAAACIF